MTGQNGTNGRRRGYARPTEDAPIIGEDVELQVEHQEAMDTTESNDKKMATKRELRNKLKAIIEFLQEKYRITMVLWRSLKHRRVVQSSSSTRTLMISSTLGSTGST